MKASMTMTRRSFLAGTVAAAMLAALPFLPGCAGGDAVTGTWYGVDDSGNLSTLEIDGDGTWLFNGKYAANGDWEETDGGTIVLSAPLMSVPFEMEGTSDERMLVFAGEDPSYGNAPEISRSTFYATEDARDAAVADEE